MILSGLDFKRKYQQYTLVKYLHSNDFSKPQPEHHNYHYKLGENTIPENEVRLDINRQCSAGGLYFTFIGAKRDWINNHCFFVTVPDDAQVLEENNDKFKTDKLIILREADEEWYFERISLNIRWLQHIRTEDLCCSILYNYRGRLYGEYVLKYIKEQTPKICLVAVQQYGEVLEYVKEEFQTPEICLTAVQQNARALLWVKEEFKTPELCLVAVQRRGWVLKYVKEEFKTPELCLAAVRQDGGALEYVKEQTEELCLAAVRKDGIALQYVKDQTPELCLAACRQNGEALYYVKEEFRIPETFF